MSCITHTCNYEEILSLFVAKILKFKCRGTLLLENNPSCELQGMLFNMQNNNLDHGEHYPWSIYRQRAKFSAIWIVPNSDYCLILLLIGKLVCIQAYGKCADLYEAMVTWLKLRLLGQPWLLMLRQTLSSFLQTWKHLPSQQLTEHTIAQRFSSDLLHSTMVPKRERKEDAGSI